MSPVEGVVLTVVDLEDGAVTPGSAAVLAAAQALSDQVEAVTFTAAATGAPDVATVHRVELPAEPAPEHWGEAMAQLIRHLAPAAVLAEATDRGNELMAHAAARAGLPLATNCVTITPGNPWHLTRTRGGGVLLEDAELTAPVALVTIAPSAGAPPTVDLATVDPTAGGFAAAGLAAVDRANVDPVAVDLVAVDRSAVDLAAVDPVALDLAAVDPSAGGLATGGLAAVDRAAIDLVAVDPSTVDRADGVAGSDADTATVDTASPADVTGAIVADGTTGTAAATATATATGTAGIAATAATAGTAGIVGTAGTAGTAGIVGTAGTAAAAGIATTAGTAGTAGIVGTVGVVEVRRFVPELGHVSAHGRLVERTGGATGVTLATARVVVSGGRGVGGADGFAVLERLAELVGGAVGCSRVATNNGWRPHSDQVGLTGTRITPDLYIACGISGATQHWVGCMDARRILAINTDPAAPMVTRAAYAVIGDVHQILPAVIEEIGRRTGR